MLIVGSAGNKPSIQDGADSNKSAPGAAFDHSTHEEFYRYYAEESASPEALVRMRRVRDHVMKFLSTGAPGGSSLDVADIGCGAGAQSMTWAELGHRVHALDVNEQLVQLGRERSSTAGFEIDFRVGSATNLPWPDKSMDVCLALELLEHVEDWEKCLTEFTRILRVGGWLFFTTTNALCPIQAEFNLPLYSWYPGPLKRHYVQLALTKRPELANYAKYPAYHWFTFYGLRKFLKHRGFRSLDRFDITNLEEKGAAARSVISAIRALPPLRFAAQVCTPGTIILAQRQS
jgi:ubiquinone/menaquinone biosynthesis C-methylase UbiE